MVGVPQYSIRLYGDPVLRQRAPDVDTVDGQLKQLADDMVQTMYEAPGVGLAAPQVGVQKRMFVYDANDGQGPRAVVNPVLSDSRGEWVYDEGCLSVPGLSWPIVRPKEVHLTGYDLDGNELSIEADEFTARLFQHEVDHLDGVLLVEHLDDDQRKEAMRILRGRALGLPEVDDGATRGGAGAPPAGHAGL
jgi:peptide deformylase